MSKNWTNKQKEAIEARGKTLLISAAAGSGKTATLTERIVRKITDENAPASIDKMLIVTFTRMSAADLKRKLSSAISDELAKEVWAALVGAAVPAYCQIAHLRKELKKHRR